MRVLLLVLAGCSGVQGVDALGGGQHDVSALSIEVLGTAANGLSTPSDVSINPNRPGTVWVTNYGANRITVLEAGTWRSFDGPGSNHFLVNPMSLSFTDFGDFATIHDTDDVTQPSTPADFMGPVLWDDSEEFDGGHGGHLDMLHNSPLGGGIAWESDRIFWVFDGYHSSLTRYNFNDDHGYGGSDHSDGEIDRFVEGEVSRIETIPSHMDFDPETGLLYAADTANRRIVTLDTATGTIGPQIGPNYDGVPMHSYTGAELSPLVTTELDQPAGLELDGDLVYVTDHGTSEILAFDRFDGELLDWVELDYPRGSLGGIEVDTDGTLLVTILSDNTVLRIGPQE